MIAPPITMSDVKNRKRAQEAQLSALMTKARSELDAPPAAEEEQP